MLDDAVELALGSGALARLEGRLPGGEINHVHEFIVGYDARELSCRARWEGIVQ